VVYNTPTQYINITVVYNTPYTVHQQYCVLMYNNDDLIKLNAQD